MGDQAESELLTELEHGPLAWFRDWPGPGVHLSREGAGVYSIWNLDGDLVYVGVAGRPSKGAPKGRGLFGRLNAHASGKRSGDQFCVYVADRLVLPELGPEDIADISNGKLSFDERIRVYIREHLGFRSVVTPNFQTALRIEDSVKAVALRVGPPKLNPHSR